MCGMSEWVGAWMNDWVNGLGDGWVTPVWEDGLERNKSQFLSPFNVLFHFDASLSRRELNVICVLIGLYNR